jgi:transposase
MSINGSKRKWAASDKLRIVLAGMQPNVEVSELCRREGIHPTQYYGWKKQLLSSAGKIFDAQENKRSAAEERKEAELVRFKNVIAELTAENLELKKTF